MKAVFAVILCSLFLAASAVAAPPPQGTVSVPDVTHGATTVATVSYDPGFQTYVFVQCYNPEYVYAAYFDVVDGEAVVGPLTSSLWTSGPAECTAKHGYFTRDGFGKWKQFAETTFSVS